MQRVLRAVDLLFLAKRVTVILSRRSAAKDLKLRRLRSFAVYAAQDDGDGTDALVFMGPSARNPNEPATNNQQQIHLL